MRLATFVTPLLALALAFGATGCSDDETANPDRPNEVDRGTDGHGGAGAGSNSGGYQRGEDRPLGGSGSPAGAQ